MCRSIKTLYNFDPPASSEEVHDAALQFVRKLSGFRNPSRANQKAFDAAVDSISKDTQILLRSLRTDTKAKDRNQEAQKIRERTMKRFGA
jgi:hypothetical protein